MPQKVVLIFDIGKTNKKALVLDINGQMVASQAQKIETLVDEDGFPCENLPALTDWLLRTLDGYLADSAYQVVAVNVSAYGATWVHTDASGHPLTPVYDYLKPIPAEWMERFYAQNGGKETLCIATASPPLGMLNAGVHLMWLKEYQPSVFESVKWSLQLPQYLSFLISGIAATERTSLGCHTALWNFRENDYHAWTGENDVQKKLPPIYATSSTETVTRHGQTFQCGVGIHDSSAALATFLEAVDEPFLLVSTGTWSITLNAFSEDNLTQEDLQNDCLNYLSYRGEQVRASRLFLGNEHDRQVAAMAAHFKCPPDTSRFTQPNWPLFDRLIGYQDYAQLLEYNGNPMLRLDYNRFATYEEAYYGLIIELSRWQIRAIRLAAGSTNIKHVYLSGGFCQNILFTAFLADLLPNYTLYRADVSQASALGAAIVIKDAWNPDVAIGSSSFVRLKGRG